ncbi:MAG: DUF2971 domain-containing protein [Flavobacterium sp.]|nr:DUF2971 domain-containing protein [Flavobacterium sp.]
MQEYTFNNFVYKRNENSKIIVEHNVQKPESIFKFYAINEYSVDAFTNSYFYASHPYDLNDFLDSSPFLFWTSKPLDFHYYESFLGFLYTENQEELKKFYEDDISRESLCKGYMSLFWEVLSNKIGVVSMTAKENNPLMWPHYTQEKGFQIKFKTEDIEQNIEKNIRNENGNNEYLGFIPTNYTKDLVPIDISNFPNMKIPLYYITNIKSINWNYECEWRFLLSKENMGVPYSKTGLSGREDYFVKKENRFAYYDKNLVQEITLGMNFFNTTEYQITMLDEKNIQVKLKANWNFESQKKLLNFVFENLKDKLYYSGVKYEINVNDDYCLIRTKEKLEIERKDEITFVLTRTNILIKML